MQQGQSTFDYLVLTGVILVVIVPLLFVSTDRIDRNRLAELQDALGALKDGITQVNNLGFGTSSVVVVRVPKGVTEQLVGFGGTPWCQAGMLCYRVAGSDLAVTVPADVAGILPLNEGIHYIQLFNNGTHVLLYECGNNRREAFEQCDGSDNSACGGVLASCAPPSHPQACKCFCTSNLDCRGTTGLCDIPTGVCIPCSRNTQCVDDFGNPTDQVCLGGRCVDPLNPSCNDNADCISPSYPSVVCNRQLGLCEPCDQPPRTPYYINSGVTLIKDCNPGHTCQVFGAGIPSFCGIPPIIPPISFDFSIQVFPSSGSVQPGDFTSALVTVIHVSGTPEDVVFSATGVPSSVVATFNPSFCRPSPLGACTSTMRLQAQPTAPTVATPSTITVVGTSGSVTRTAPYALSVICTNNNQCITYPNAVCITGECHPCTINSQCTNPPHNECNTGICVGGPIPCSSNNECSWPSEVCNNVNNATGVCEPCNTPPAPLCGLGFACNIILGICVPAGTTPLCNDGLFEVGEECEQATHCSPRAGMTASCTNCLCGYTLTGGGGGEDPPELP